MVPLLALALLAVARAAIIEVPKTIIEDDFIDPRWASSMFTKYGLKKPLLEDVSVWGKTIGVEDPMILNRMRSFYDKPALVFFQEPSGKVVSYFAHEGIDKPISIPELKSALYGLYGASDKLAINFHPEHMLGPYRTVLPGHFFEPVNNIDLHHFLNDMPITPEHVTFKPNPMMKDFWKKIDIEDLPMIYKEPVSLDIGKKFMSEGVVPHYHVSPFTGFSGVSSAVPFGYGRSGIIPGASNLVSGMPFTGFSDFSTTGAVPFGFGRSGIFPGASGVVSGMPFTGFSDHSATGAVPFEFGRSGIFPKTSHLVSGMPFGFRSALGVAPAVKSAAYHLVKADMPYFTAAPAAGFVDAAGFPLVKSAFASDATGFSPVHAINAAPGLRFVHAASPLFTSATPFAKAAIPSVNFLGAEHAFTPVDAGVIPLVKSFGTDALTHFGDNDAYRSAFTGLSAEPTITFGADPTTSYSSLVKTAPVTTPLFVNPSVGLTGFAVNPFKSVPWKKF